MKCGIYRHISMFFIPRKGIYTMKIRTFLTCKGVEVKENLSDFTIQHMYYMIATKEFPTEENITMLMTFDEVELIEKKLEIALFNNKDTFLASWIKEMEPSNNAILTSVSAKFYDAGDYYFKISYNKKFLGKYPLSVIPLGEGEKDE